MMFRFHTRTVWLGSATRLVGSAVAFLLFASMASAAWARNGGVASESCSGCHRGGAAPTITITPNNMEPMLGESVRITLSFDVGSARNIGFYINASTGTLIPVSGEPTKVLGDGISHSSPINASGGRVTVHADWKAPSSPGGVDFRAAVVSGNGDSRSGGDGAGTSFLSIPLGCSGGATYYRDFDGDGFGYEEKSYTRSCGKPEGYADKLGDCDDNDPKIFNGAPEVCNRRDDNCNGTTDEGLEGVILYPDKDGDGWGLKAGPTDILMGCRMETGWGIEGNDCDDKDAKIFPGATEVCNLKDDNCNGRIDEGARAECGLGWCRRLASSCDASSCVAGKPVKERCNGLDDDCDGQVDEEPKTLCAEGTTCFDGECTPTADVPPGAAGGEAGSGSDPGSDSSGCSYAPRNAGSLAAWLAISLAALIGLWLRRSA